jgi:hypothetical protein
MTTGRGREARLRPEYLGLYRGIQATDWRPIEVILQQVDKLPPEDRAKAEPPAGTRRLPDAHFEFRGSSPRPDGFPPRLSRVTDADAEPRRVASLHHQLEAEEDQLAARQREAEQTIARAEHLRERADALRQDFERLRKRAAELELRPEPSGEEEQDTQEQGGRPDQP